VNNIKIKSYCKINLSLKVLKKLNSGYHNIISLITFCDLHDVISISRIRNLKDEISFSGRFKKGINKKSNTITKVMLFVDAHHWCGAMEKFDLCGFQHRKDWKVFLECGHQPA